VRALCALVVRCGSGGRTSQLVVSLSVEMFAIGLLALSRAIELFS